MRSVPIEDEQNLIDLVNRPNMEKFVWDDPFLLEDQLTNEEKMFRDSARSFANEHLVGRVRKAYTDEIVDTETIPLMGKLGLLGVTLPEKYGGVGANYVSYGLVAREIERIDSGYRSMMSVQSSLVIYPIYAYGSDVQKDKYLRDPSRYRPSHYVPQRCQLLGIEL